MANIKNFGLVGVGSDVQFGKSGPRLVNAAGAFQFKDAAGQNNVDVSVKNVKADDLSAGAGKLVTIGSDGKLTLDAAISSLATTAGVSSDIATAKAAVEADLATETSARTTADSALQGQITAIETGAGLTNAGAYAPDTAANYIGGATSLFTADQLLDAAIKQVATDLANLGSGSLTSLQAEVDTMETAIGLNADGTLAAITGTNYVNAATTVMGAVTLLDTAIKSNADAISAETTRATAAEDKLTTDLASEVTRATTAEGTLQTAIDTEQTRATTAETALSDRITHEVADRTAADNTIASNLAAETTARETADTAFQTALDKEVSDRAAADVTLKNYVDSKLAGLTWEAPVDTIVADITSVDLSAIADGTRYYDEATHTIFTITGGAKDAGYVMVDGSAFFHKGDEVGYVFNGTALVQFNGAANIVAGDAIAKTGNTIAVKFDATTVVLDATGNLRVAQSILDSISANGSAITAETQRAETAEQGLDQRITDEVNARTAADTAMQGAYQAADTTLQANIDAEVTRAKAAEGTLTTDLSNEITRATGVEAALQAELDATQAGAGLSTDGTYAADAGSNYIKAATSLFNADQKLDAALKSLSDTVNTLSTTGIGAVQSELDQVEASIGLGTDGKFVTFTGTNFLNGTTTIVGGLTALDTALQAEITRATGAESTLTTNLNGEIARAEAAEATLTTDLGNEVTRAEAAETALGARIDALTTDVVAEGTTNLYFTAARARAALAVANTTDSTDTSVRLAYNSSTGLFSLVNAASVKSVADALQSAKDYTDSKVQAGVANAARAVYAMFNGADAVIGTVKGLVHRVKVYVTSAGATDSAIQVGDATINNSVATTADVDSSVAGVYVVEVNAMFATDTALTVFVGDASAAGTVVVEYL